MASEPEASLAELAQRMTPHLDVVSVSNPSPRLRAFNAIASVGDEAEARQLVLALEAEIADDAEMGIVVMSADPERPVEPRIDPEHVTGYVARRAVLGAMVGALVGALLIGGAVAIVTGRLIPTLAGALGGAAFGFAPGAIYRTFAGLGGSDAYRQSFVAPEIADAALVSVHTDDPQCLTAALARLRDRRPARLVVVDGAGREVDITSTDDGGNADATGGAPGGP